MTAKIAKRIIILARAGSAGGGTFGGVMVGRNVRVAGGPSVFVGFSLGAGVFVGSGVGEEVGDEVGVKRFGVATCTGAKLVSAFFG